MMSLMFMQVDVDMLACRFHGKEPSKNKQEKRLRKIQEDMEQKRLASSEQPDHSSLKRLHAIQVSVIPFPFLVWEEIHMEYNPFHRTCISISPHLLPKALLASKRTPE